MVGDYLTTTGGDTASDLEEIEAAGLQPENHKHEK